MRAPWLSVIMLSLLATTLEVLGACGEATGPDQSPASLTISPQNVGLEVGATASLMATIRARDGSLVDEPVVWSSVVPDVAVVSEEGVVAGVSPGFAEVTAKADTLRASIIVEVFTPPAEPLAIKTTSLSAARAGLPYRDSLAAVGGDGSYSWAVVQGALPPGILLSGGILAGIPTVADNYPLTVEVRSGDGQIVQASWTIHVLTVQLSPLVAFLPLDGNGVDASGNGHDGEPVGIVQVAKDVFGEIAGALRFDGTSYLQLDDLDLPASFTIALWAKPELQSDGGLRGAFIGRFIAPGNWEINVNELTHQVVFHTNTNTGPFSADSLDAGKWYHVVVTYDDGVGRIFLGGVQVAEKSDMGPPPASDVPVRVGRSAWGGNGYVGTIDDILILGRAMLPTEVAALFEERRPPS